MKRFFSIFCLLFAFVASLAAVGSPSYGGKTKFTDQVSIVQADVGNAVVTIHYLKVPAGVLSIFPERIIISVSIKKCNLKNASLVYQEFISEKIPELVLRRQCEKNYYNFYKPFKTKLYLTCNNSLRQC